MKRVVVVFAGVLIALVGVGGSAQGTLIDLMLKDQPDISVGFMDVMYDAGNALLVADGDAFTLDDGSGPVGIDSGTTSITAGVSDSGTLSGGTVTVNGTIPSLGFNSGTLLTGDLTQLGFATNGADLLEFAFNVTGGDAAGLYGNTPAGIILGFGGFSGSFEDDFDNTGGTPGMGFATADIGLIAPEPATLGLLLLGSAGMIRRRR